MEQVHMGSPVISIGPRVNPLGALLARASGPVSRSRRVCILLTAIVLMSLADLDMTLAYARSVGLLEGNPLARLVMTYGSSWILALWKVASVALCIFILFSARRTRFAEIGAWICFMVMVWLTLRWVTYNEQVPFLTSYMADQHRPDHRLVTLGDEGRASQTD
jgi:hypothetical protein